MTYSIIRFYHPSQDRENEVVQTGLTLEEAQTHCRRHDTKVEGVYFDGYAEE